MKSAAFRIDAVTCCMARPAAARPALLRCAISSMPCPLISLAASLHTRTSSHRLTVPHAHSLPTRTRTHTHTQVLAGELQLDMCILNLTSNTLTDDSLAAMLREAPSRAIIVLEDVDAIFVSREEQERQSWDGSNGSGNEGKAKTTVSFSGLLNAIDGVAAQEGRIFYMTTVHFTQVPSCASHQGLLRP